MTHLPRLSKPAVLLAVLFTLLALPVVWTQQAPWHGIAPALSHAGGSPDETLKPPPTPTGKVAAFNRPTETYRVKANEPAGRAGLAVRVRAPSPAWVLYGKIYLSALLRF